MPSVSDKMGRGRAVLRCTFSPHSTMSPSTLVFFITKKVYKSLFTFNNKAQEGVVEIKTRVEGKDLRAATGLTYTPDMYVLPIISYRF